MTDALGGKRILVLEDNYYLASDMAHILAGAGARVIGPFGDQATAQRSLAATMPDAAFLDVNTGAGPSFALARALRSAQVPFAFATGYDRASIPVEFADVARCEKPVDGATLLAMAARLVTG